MFTRCLACHSPYPAGTLVAEIPVARRVAYDPERGRLWTLCDRCGAWSLVPMEERWEALEALERRVTDDRHAPVLAASTDHVALYLAEGGEIVRIDRAGLGEQAAWRYGLPRARRRRGVRGAHPLPARPLSIGERCLGGAFVLRSLLAGRPFGGPAAVRRRVRFGDVAWRGSQRCASCGFMLRELSYFDARLLILRSRADGHATPSLVRACPQCHDEGAGGLHLEGTEAEFVLRSALAYRHDGGVTEARLHAAMGLIDAGGAEGLGDVLVRVGRYLGDLPETSSVALRIMADDARERRLLQLEAAQLERVWRQEEELAAIIDDQLTPYPGLEGRRVGRASR